MSLAKRAQFWDDNFLKEEDKKEDFGEILVDGFESLLSDLSVEDDGNESEDNETEDNESEEGIFFESDISSENDKVTGDVSVSLGDLNGFEELEEFSFTLPKFPGSDVEDDIELEVEEDDSNDEQDSVSIDPTPTDPWDYGKLSNFAPWLKRMLDNVPRHSGYETTGVERAIAYLEALNRSISKAVRSDIRNELNISSVEQGRKEILNGIKRLQERLIALTPRKKKSELQTSLVKEAQKITGVSGIMVTVPLIISRAARVCINGMVSAGHDIEDLYDGQVKAYGFNVQQQAELLQLLEDMGYPLRRDRGFLPNEKIDTTRSDNYDWAANYPA